MRKTTALWLSLIVSALISIVIGINLPAEAQGEVKPQTATPRPSPTGNGGKAHCAVKSEKFESQYPAGFSFSGEIESSGGKIVEARVNWQHSLTVRRSAVAKIDDTGTKLTANWEANAGNAVPQWVGVEYWWTLTDAAGNTYQTPRQYAEYADNTRKWHRAESEDIIVFWEDGVPDKVGQLTIDAMKEQRAFYLKNWGKLLNYRPRAIIYLNKRSWEEWAPAVRSSNTIGTTNQGWGGTVQVYIRRYGPEDVAYGTVLHEVGHLYQYYNGGLRGDCWFYEGNATYFELRQQYDYLGRVQEMAESGKLPSLQDGGPSCRSLDQGRDAYDIGYAFFKWMEETYGGDAHAKLWGLVAKGKTQKEALESVTGLNFVEMETEFRSWLGASDPNPPTPVPTMGFDFPPTPTYETDATAKP